MYLRAPFKLYHSPLGLFGLTQWLLSKAKASVHLHYSHPTRGARIHLDLHSMLFLASQKIGTT